MNEAETKAAPKEVINYTPGFQWIEFRRSYNSIALYSAPITAIIENYIRYLQEQESKQEQQLVEELASKEHE